MTGPHSESCIAVVQYSEYAIFTVVKPHPLERLRKGAAMTQVELASAASMTQAEISRLERRDTLEGVRIETLRRYVEGLGGSLELVVRFPKKRQAVDLGKRGKR